MVVEKRGIHERVRERRMYQKRKKIQEGKFSKNKEKERRERSTYAISQVAPVMYAHLAAAQMATAVKFEDSSETSSSHGGITTSEAVLVSPMPKLNVDVATSMFFC
ncbi:hypothetical protein YC2023_123266 [Brassica napus]